ncbi:DNA polymerase epsilon subunit 4-like [Orbicella faveolata]|uniref:DNA polymerase epsilon subunit 4-like n=1 Tax=Orbicella faveolata TaxID=48498 RepID=UPI0009E5098C|nr:DNA polymerase epsilon subunit 4-like [Orbicella faveolata]
MAELVADSTEISSQNEENSVVQDEDQRARLTQFPQTRVRNMMKIDPDLHLANRESVFLLTRAAELFVEHFAKEAHKRTVIGKRKTIQKRDLDTTVDENEEMAFLEGTLD